jgi:dipeptide/tripeptide permease
VSWADRSLVGTMLTVQTCAGFLLTLATIHIVPWLVELAGWRYAFAFLALGPVFGIWAMIRLRAHPDAYRLANANR